MPVKQPVTRADRQKVHVLNNPLNVAIDSTSPTHDAFGRMRVSSPTNRFDIEFIYDKQPVLMDEVTTTGGTVTHNSGTRDLTLAINNTTNGSQAAMYSTYYVPYTPGNSQLIDATATLDDADIGGGTAFVFVRDSTSGSVVETTVAQTSWDNPVSDVDWTKSQIFSIDFQSLKVGRVEFYLNRGGKATHVHGINHDNTVDDGFWQSPTLPLYWRIYNDATYTYMEVGYGDAANGVGFRYRIAANGSATMRAICGTVKSEGGYGIMDMPGERRAITRTTAATVAATLIPLLSIRQASTFNSITNRGLAEIVGFEITADNDIEYRILYDASLTGPSWTAVDSTYSSMEYDVTASALSGGIVVDGGIVLAGGVSDSVSNNVLDRVLLSNGVGGQDTLTIAAVRKTATSSSSYATFRWKEIR